jgi:putative cardiolipin synthase
MPPINSKYKFRPHLLTLTLVFCLTGCTSLPSRQGQIDSFAPDDTGNTYLGIKFSGVIQKHPGRSGFVILSDGLDAFAARAAMIKLAEKTIDVQYYFIRYDSVGSAFMGLLTEAANRGVRVRILLDDHYLADKDEKLLAVDGHPNIELRTFNPFRRGTPRFLQYMSNFGSISRRMHNKSFTVDNQVTVLGGRNIGDEYFAADEEIEFGDLDVMGIGPIVREVSRSFDSYWNNPLAYTPAVLLNRTPTDAKVRAQANELTASLLQETRYGQLLGNTKIIEALRNDSLAFEWAESTLIADSPDKLRVSRSRSDLHLQRVFGELFAKAENEVIIYSPYFIPGKTGSKGLAALVEKGVKVRIFTNSATSNNVGMVHAHYSKYRKRLLKSGVELFEVRQTAADDTDQDTGAGAENESGEKVKKIGAATVHAKTFAIDRKTVFIGSFNFDPRSVIENTEIGVVIESENIGRQFGAWFDENIDNIGYRLSLHNGSINWLENSTGQTVVNKKEPGTNWWTRAKFKILGWLPVGGLL